MADDDASESVSQVHALVTTGYPDSRLIEIHSDQIPCVLRHAQHPDRITLGVQADPGDPENTDGIWLTFRDEVAGELAARLLHAMETSPDPSSDRPHASRG